MSMQSLGGTISLQKDMVNYASTEVKVFTFSDGKFLWYLQLGAGFLDEMMTDLALIW